MADSIKREVIIGDTRDILPTLPEKSFHCCVTSPPFYGLRDYGTAEWEGGDAGCDHLQKRAMGKTTLRNDGRKHKGAYDGEKALEIGTPFSDICRKCGARRIDSQIGLEPTPDEYVAELVKVFREVRRVLRDDGTVWLNLGDSFQSKNLLGIPWRVAFALQSDGWILRQDIIWSKKNPMPESATDRCTKSHEYLFMLSKRPRYYFDAKAIAEPSSETSHGGPRVKPGWKNAALGQGDGNLGKWTAEQKEQGRNRRSVWTVTTQPFKSAHFATFPPKLIEPCILAGCPAQCCGECGAPYVRQTEQTTTFMGGSGRAGRTAEDVNSTGKWAGRQYGTNLKLGPTVSTKTIGFTPSCDCNAAAIPGRVLDPFGGAGTTGLVADRLQRRSTMIELNPAYAAMAQERIEDDAPLLGFIDMPHP